MTNEKAIKGLLNVKMQICEETPFSKAVDLAVMALEKQIPKKPIITKFENGVEIINCGKCYMITHITRAADYCPHCGTKIDWGENE